MGFKMPVTIRQFRDECVRQGVESKAYLASGISEGGLYGHDEELLAEVINYVGESLRKHPVAQANKPIDAKVWQGDTLALALTDIVNATVEPVDDPKVASFKCGGAKTIGACYYGEINFAETIDGIRQLNQCSGHEYTGAGCDIFTRNGTPLFLRKNKGEPSGLSLEPFAINGIPFPQGSIVRIDTEDEWRHGQYPTPAAETIRKIDVRDIAKIAFVRLSIWSFPPEDRNHAILKKYASPHNFVGRWDLVTSASIENVKSMVQQSISPEVPVVAEQPLSLSGRLIAKSRVLAQGAMATLRA